jgi:hypothetical protein
MYQTKSINNESTISDIDSISSTFIEKQKGLRFLTQRIVEEKVKRNNYLIISKLFFF